MKKSSKTAKILIVVLVLIAGLALGFVYWAEAAFEVMDEAVQAMASTSRVSVSDTRSYISFMPVAGSDTGLILYPGARVEPESYAVLAHSIAESGINVYLVRMPLDLAFFKINAADEVREENPAIENWYLGGHSLGGAMSCEYARNNSSNLRGLVLLAAYPAQNTDLSQTGLRVISISAEFDGLATPAEINTNKELLPDNAAFTEIKGGNHQQFGYYVHQKGDLEASISRERQTALIAETILGFIQSANVR